MKGTSDKKMSEIKKINKEYFKSFSLSKDERIKIIIVPKKLFVLKASE